jgi:hypothetical protein
MDAGIVNPPLEGRIYGEISGWMTVIGIIISIAGVTIGLMGNSIFDYSSTIYDLLKGCPEGELWVKDSKFHSEPYGYWFLTTLNTGDGIAMFGIAVAIYGGIIGIICLLISMLRSKEVLFYKKGTYFLLALTILAIMMFCAWEAEFAMNI